MLRSRRLWFGIIVSAAFLALFLYQNRDFGEIRDAFAEANAWLAFASLPVYFAGLWVRAIRWQYLLRPVARIPVRRLYPVVVIGLMANNLIPARAGELVRAYVVGERERVSKAAALGTIAVDRLFDGLTLIPMVVVIAAVAGGHEEFDVDLAFASFSAGFEGLALIMAVLFGLALGVLVALAFSPRLREWSDTLVTRLTPERFRESLEGIARSFFTGLDCLRSPIDLAVAWVLSGVSWTLEATMYYMIGVAFGIDVGFHIYLLLTAAANLLMSILASQGGIGPFEFAAQQTLIAFGVSTSTASAYAIGLHALVLLPVIVLGLYFLGTMGLSLGEMFRRSEASAAPKPAEPLPAAIPREEVPGA